MDYEQKYKEALERAKELKNKLEKSCSLATPTGIESIFPELKESEDERIRKEVEKAAKDWYKENYEGENPQGKALMISAYIDGAIAWLEKQGELMEKPTKEQLIDKTCEWIKEHNGDYISIVPYDHLTNDFYDDLRKAMKGE